MRLLDHGLHDLETAVLLAASLPEPVEVDLPVHTDQHIRLPPICCHGASCARLWSLTEARDAASPNARLACVRRT